jgi:hypothetical protein
LVVPQPPTEVVSLKIQTSLQRPGYDLWLEEIVPNFEEISQSCHCQKDFSNVPRIQNYVVTGSLEEIMFDDLTLERLQRGPDFRESPRTSFEYAYKALEDALTELRLMHKAPPEEFDFWSHKLLSLFRQAQRQCSRNTPLTQQAFELNTVKGTLKSKHRELQSYLGRYTFLVADKSRGNFVMVCNNLFKMKCVETLSKGEDYQQTNLRADNVSAHLYRDLVGLLNYRHIDLTKENLPYFYMLPKLHKQPIGWRSVTACQGTASKIPHRIIAQCLRLVLNTLKEFHAKELRETGLRKWWTVENSLEYVLARPEIIKDLFSSDIESMFSKMDQATVFNAVSTEVRFAAQLVHANAFFVVIYDTRLGNSADECC